MFIVVCSAVFAFRFWASTWNAEYSMCYWHKKDSKRTKWFLHCFFPLLCVACLNHVMDLKVKKRMCFNVWAFCAVPYKIVHGVSRVCLVLIMKFGLHMLEKVLALWFQRTAQYSRANGASCTYLDLEWSVNLQSCCVYTHGKRHSARTSFWPAASYFMLCG